MHINHLGNIIADDASPPRLPRIGELVTSTADLPRGATALDRNGDRLIVWPDGRYGYVGQRRHVGSASSVSTGPYTIEQTGLDAIECDMYWLGAAYASSRRVHRG